MCTHLLALFYVFSVSVCVHVKANHTNFPFIATLWIVLDTISYNAVSLLLCLLCVLCVRMAFVLVAVLYFILPNNNSAESSPPPTIDVTNTTHNHPLMNHFSYFILPFTKRYVKIPHNTHSCRLNQRSFCPCGSLNGFHFVQND